VAHNSGSNTKLSHRKGHVYMVIKVFALLASVVYLFSSISTYRIFIPNVTSTASNTSSSGALAVSAISDNRGEYSGSAIPQYSKFEITFQIQNSVAQNFQFPYDPTPPNGIKPAYPEYNGISVDAYFLPPGLTDWNKAFHQPAFYYQYFEDQVKQNWDATSKEWFYPTGGFAWKVRFAPNSPGTWQYRINARDASGTVQSGTQSFSVTSSNNSGFIKVSPTDTRYFQFDNGKVYNPLGFEGTGNLSNPTSSNQASFQAYGQNGVNLDRVWISSIFGTSWQEWIGGRNLYDGYLPRTGTESFHDPIRNKDTMAMVVDYEPAGDTGWYDACRFQFWSDPEPVKQNTKYRLQITYWGSNISGPRVAGSSNYGLVGKIGGDWDNNCYEPGTGNVVTNYGKNSSDWNTLTGTWNSGSNNFVRRIYLGMENVTQGRAVVQSVSLREDLGNGKFGPELIRDHSLDYETYFREQSAYALDKIVNLAEKNGTYLKLVLMDKNDMLFEKLNDDGTLVSGGQDDNTDGFYGQGRVVNKARWLQQAWWRYLQARWGYSTALQSWEATNEGDPWNVANYEMTDEMGKYLHCTVFGVAVGVGDGQKCASNQPDSHLVSTSFWHSFPATQFWMNSKYPNVDFADLHAYVSTSNIGLSSTELTQMQWDSALYHIDHSLAMGGWKLGKPVIRGEAGIDSPGNQTEQPGLAQDKYGVWLHNFLWSTLDPGGMSESYWWAENINTQPGPDGQKGLYEVFKYFSTFLGNIPLNNGHYADIQAALSDANLKATGQKDALNNRAHLWVYNAKHTWKNVVDGVSGISGLTGTVTITGFTPNRSLTVEWDAFKTDGKPVISTSTVTSDSQGRVVLSLPTDTQITDVGIKVGSY
jgi:hypothetical protein